MFKGLLKIKSMTTLFLVLTGLFIFSGCSRFSSILFIYKNYSYEILESNARSLENLKKNCKDNSYIPEFAIITKKGEESIMDIINETEASVIFVDPLILESPGNISGKFQDKLFFTLERNPGRVKPLNLLTIHYDRGDTFKQAGIITGKLLLKGLSNKQDGNNVKGKKAGMIIYPASLEIQKESSEYMSGFFTVHSEELFVYREVNNIEDKVKIKSIMDEMMSDGVVIIFLRLYFLNTYCLDYLKKQGGYAIVENWYSASGYEDTVLFTIEDDFPGSLGDLFQNIRIREDGTSEWKKKEIKGKVTIQWRSNAEYPE